MKRRREERDVLARMALSVRRIGGGVMKLGLCAGLSTVWLSTLDRLRTLHTIDIMFIPTYPFSTHETARYINCSLRAVQLWVAQGEFPNAYKINPSRRNSPYRIPRADVEAFLAKRQTRPAQSFPAD